ncbi:PilZ domain-containing protein [Aestuariivirga sp.]|uniref:PilZ domain-containing protein n=1 Tax=Aestuariivirga sp. TaxID=2650926 RepID=UPI0039E3D403
MVSAVATEPNVDHITNKMGSTIIFGRFMLPDMTEHACQVLDITQQGAIFITATLPATNSSIVAYLEELGRVEVIAGEQVAGGFRVRYAATGSRLERLQQRIEWLRQKHEGAAEARRHPRFEPKDKHSSITLPDGRVYNCEVIDISISGAGIRTDILPAIGTFVMLGKMKGKVVRYLENGVAIEFMKQLEKSDLTQGAA